MALFLTMQEFVFISIYSPERALELIAERSINSGIVFKRIDGLTGFSTETVFYVRETYGDTETGWALPADITFILEECDKELARRLHAGELSNEDASKVILMSAMA